MTEQPNKTPTVVGSARIISSCIFLSRILGFVRDVLCAGFFGWVWDAFIFAFTIPNLFRRLFGEGALSAAFIPVLSDYHQHKPQSETRRLINNVISILFSFLSLIALAIIAVSFLFPILLPSPTQPGFTPLFARLLRIMIPYLPIICLLAMLTAILNTLKHFTTPALASVVLNISWISGFFLAPLFSPIPEKQIVVIAWAIIIGGVLEIIIQIPVLIHKKISYTPAWQLNHPGIKEIAKLMGPAALGLGIFQVNLLLDYIIALVFVTGDGAISALYFGNRLMQFPLALIGISLATAVFPFLAEAISRNDLTGMKQELSRALRLSNFMAIPASIGLVILALPIIDLAFNILPREVFGVKGFTETPVVRTSLVLCFYALGIWAYCGFQIVTRAFYAFKDMKTPLRIGVRMVGVNLILNIILVQFLQEAGIALATAITAMVNFFILLILLQRKIGKWASHEFVKPFMKTGLIALLMGGLCLLILMWLPEPGKIAQVSLGSALVRVFLPMLSGIIFYMGLAYLVRLKEVKEFWKVRK